MLRPSLILLALTSVLLLPGCLVSPWRPGGETFTPPSGDYTVRVPAGWMFAERPSGLIATNDGMLLQSCGLHRHNLKLPLPYSKRTLSASTTPLELAEAIADDMKADRVFQGLTVPTIEPVDFGGRPGCKLLLQYHNSSKLRYSQLMYACIANDCVYLVYFRAPTRHYFERDAAAFDELIRSFQFTGKPAFPLPAVKAK
jgi:hypothetical protein